MPTLKQVSEIEIIVQLEAEDYTNWFCNSELPFFCLELFLEYFFTAGCNRQRYCMQVMNVVIPRQSVVAISLKLKTLDGSTIEASLSAQLLSDDHMESIGVSFNVVKCEFIPSNELNKIDSCW